MYAAIFCAATLAATSDDEYPLREWGEKTANAFASGRNTYTADSPESTARIARVRRHAIIRDLDALAAAYGGYPEDITCRHRIFVCSVRWPMKDDDVPYDHWPQEFWQTVGYWVDEEDDGWPRRRYVYPTEEERRARTRSALIAYVSRTHDWRTARRILTETRR